MTDSPTPGAPPATLRDVALAAGVSVGTASKALNGGYQLRATTRRRVEVAADSLGFVPNHFARSLQGRRSGTVGMLASDLEGRFSLPILRGVEDHFGLGDIAIFLSDARGDAIRERHYLAALSKRRIDGLVIVGDDTNPRAPIGAFPVPVVYAYSPSADPSDRSIVSDNVGSGRMSAEHLIALGRRRIGVVTGSPEISAVEQRIEGVTAALEEHGLSLVGGRALLGGWEESWGRRGLEALLAADPELDGVLCGNDVIARGVLDALSDHGKSAPRDVSVVGHDNILFIATQTRPRLTTMDMDLEALGKQAARRLSEAIDGDRSGGIEAIPTRLVVRDSTSARSHL